VSEPFGGVRRLAVLGSPIAHSRSPQLHAAAYGVLGLPWEYSRADVPSGTLPRFLAELTPEWRGLSLTMPLKREVLPFLDSRSDAVESSGAANTVLFADGGTHGFNTDVAGIVGALGDHGIAEAGSVHLIGTGNTAASALLAVARLGARDVVVSGRSPDGLADLERLGERIGIPTRTRRYGDAFEVVPDLVVNTLPGHADPDDVPEADAGGALMEVPYDPWPTPRAARWAERGALVANGLEMLLHQAVEQVRIFVTGAEGGALEREAEVVAAMRTAVGLSDRAAGK
jgi:Shikimate 5-dehydrogenase